MLTEIAISRGAMSPIAIATAAAVAMVFVGLIVRRLQPVLAARWGMRIALYVATAIRTGAVTAAVLVIVWCLGLANGQASFEAALAWLGLHLHFPFDEGAALTVAMVAASAVVSAVVGIVRRAAGGAPTQAALDFLPKTVAERAVFMTVLAPIGSAGEEVIYRGFLMGQIWGLTENGWVAVALSSCVFGLMHGYQGLWGMLRTGVIGFVLAAGVLLTGSLVPSIVAHFVANVLGASFRVGAGRE